MKSDISKNTFRARNRFSSVRLQQGRVVTDADWNEQADLTRHRVERQAEDVIGHCGAPLHGAGFGLAPGSFARAVFARNSVTWAVGEDGVAFRSGDNGASWQRLDTGTTAHLHAAAFPNNSTGWIAGDRGTLLRTGDAGANWTAQVSGTLSTLRGLSAAGTSSVWAVGDGGVILRTEDGGSSWISQSVAGVRLTDVEFTNVDQGIAVGHAGTILRSTDRGVTWAPVESGTEVHLRAVCFHDDVEGWAVGDDGTVLHTNDGGQSWTAQSTPDDRRLLSVAFRSAIEGWAVGEAGVALYTKDGGATWALIDPGTAETLRGVSLPTNTNSGWIVGDASAKVRVDPSASPSPGVALEPFPAASFSILPGRFYAGGTLCELEQRVSYYNQPDRGEIDALEPGTHLVYVDVWQRHLSALQVPEIREVALGGPDTATRARTLCQVKTLPLPIASPDDWNCLSDVPAWQALIAPSGARLKARSEPQVATTNVCDIAAAAGYRRLENQLYRVEIHEGGTTPTFKWSRENGSIAFAVESVVLDVANNKTTVRLASRGRDENLDLAIDDWVEIVDDAAELERRTGDLFQYVEAGNDDNEIVVSGLVGPVGTDPARRPVLRRWDHEPSGGSATLPVQEGQWIHLEEGVQIWFEPQPSGADYRPGDYWQIPARTITGDVEWPTDADGDPLARTPAGIEDRYCRLAIIAVDGSGVTLVEDCRNLFPPVTELTQLHYVSGDGQDAAPGALLPHPLQVRVLRGRHPVESATVRFSIEAGSGGKLGPGPGAALVDVVTGADGVAECSWRLGASRRPARRHPCVRAELLDAAGDPIVGQALRFCATATIVLDHVSGDGQEGSPGNPLDHPLEVRVSNGHEMLAGVPVQFVVAAGGGTLIDSSPVTTDPNGVARMRWRLGSAGSQRVVARLQQGTTVVQEVGFNAGFRPQVGNGGGGGGCAVTIGDGGDFKQLSTELLKELLDRQKGHVCICFKPGEHRLPDIALETDGGRLSIHGCGHAAVIALEKRVVLSGFQSVEIGNLVVSKSAGGFELVGCEEVAAVDLDATPTDTDRPLLAFARCRRITVDRCRILRSLTLLFNDADATTHVTDCRLDGAVSFYGRPPARPERLPVDKIGERIGRARLETAAGQLFMADCHVGRLLLGNDMAKQLTTFAAGGLERIVGLYLSAAIEGCSFAEMENQFASGNMTLDSCSFLARDRGSYGGMVTERATATGNLAVQIDDGFPLFIATRKGAFAQAANLIFISNPSS